MIQYVTFEVFVLLDKRRKKYEKKEKTKKKKKETKKLCEMKKG